MHVISSFEPSENLELAILALERSGIDKDNIAAVPMDPIRNSSSLFDTLQRTSGVRAFDMAAVLGTVFSVLGASFGFQWRWGPIIWGLIGLAAGVCVGVALTWLANKKPRTKATNMKAMIMLIVRCDEGESKKVIRIVKEFSALSIGILA